jgi:ubiquinone/menaquinone biosynthesis C-methylase UbiE
MTDALNQTAEWNAALPLLQCPDCAGDLRQGEDGALRCPACAKDFPTSQGFLNVMGRLSGNNRVAAEYYNGPLWPKFRFWEFATFFFHGGSRRSRAQVLKHLPNLSGTRLLEVAVGDGSNLPLIPTDCEVFGIDISVSQLTDCLRKHPGRARLALGEAESLPFRDNAFDNVLSFGAFNYFSDPLKSLREMVRVVKPEGSIVVSDEYPNLPNRMIFHKIGLPQVDHWFLSRFMQLGEDFTRMVEKHRDMKLEPIFSQALDECRIYSLWSKLAYCAVGRPKK